MGVAWGMSVLGCVANATNAERIRLAEAEIEVTGLDDVLVNADFVSIHVPLNDSTRGLIDARALSLMKPSAFLVNLARGGVVDEIALRDAILSGRVAGAALDVHAKEGAEFESPLVDLPNVILTPHIGASTRSAQQQIGERVVEFISEHIANQNRKRQYGDAVSLERTGTLM